MQTMWLVELFCISGWLAAVFAKVSCFILWLHDLKTYSSPFHCQNILFGASNSSVLKNFCIKKSLKSNNLKFAKKISFEGWFVAWLWEIISWSRSCSSVLCGNYSKSCIFSHPMQLAQLVTFGSLTRLKLQCNNRHRYILERSHLRAFEGHAHLQIR